MFASCSAEYGGGGEAGIGSSVRPIPCLKVATIIGGPEAELDVGCRPYPHHCFRTTCL